MATVISMVYSNAKNCLKDQRQRVMVEARLLLMRILFMRRMHTMDTRITTSSIPALRVILSRPYKRQPQVMRLMVVRAQDDARIAGP